jgi:hypothetical protein
MCAGALEQRSRACFRMFDYPDPAGACSFQRIHDFALAQSANVRSPDQDAFHGYLVDGCGDRAVRGPQFDLEIAGQPFVLPPIRAPALTEQDCAAGPQLLRKGADSLTGAGDVVAVGRSFLGRAVDLGGVARDNDDELEGGSGVGRHLASGPVLLVDGAVDVLEDRSDCLDCPVKCGARRLPTRWRPFAGRRSSV